MRYSEQWASHWALECEQDNPKVNMRCALTYEGVIVPLFFDEDIMTSSSFWDMLGNMLLHTGAATMTTVLFFYWTVYLLILLTFFMTLWMWTSQVDVQDEEGQLHGLLQISHLWNLILRGGDCVRDKCTAKEWIHWLNSKHGSVQQLYYKGYVSMSSKRWAVGGMYTELQMALRVKCSAPNNLSIV